MTPIWLRPTLHYQPGNQIAIIEYNLFLVDSLANPIVHNKYSIDHEMSDLVFPSLHQHIVQYIGEFG